MTEYQYTSIIWLSKVGKYTIVDNEDADWLNSFKWSFKEGNYAKRNLRKADIGSKKMHRLVMDAPEGLAIDHINGNGLDNRKINLRFCSARGNSINKKRRKDNSSGFTGVYYRKNSNKWFARIYLDGSKGINPLNLGTFETAEEAAHAYSTAARLHYKEFVRI